jgi:sporadic carbohydrate cluster 2OG-Fe(II) oxygenase
MDNSISLESGFAIVVADVQRHLDALRSDVYCLVQEIFEFSDPDPERGLNDIHKHIEGLPLGRLNELRIELIGRITAECDVKERIFSAFEPTLIHLLGPDILAQKNCNLVLQPPGDPNPSELHRDAPANSPYEVVVWLPLVNCFGSKTMYILDVGNTELAFARLDADPTDWTGFENYAKSLSVRPDVRFGEALLFHTGCLHGSDINAEHETRVSLNMRYKNLFAPSGLKNQLKFFSPLRISTLARLGGRLEAREWQR